MKLTKEQELLFNTLRQSRLEDIKIFQKKDYRGVWTGIIDKYPESAHFIYELLQNADDAEATDVEIIIHPSEMIFKHNGLKHFDISSDESDLTGDINAITGIGNSSKENTQNKIGKFGVGFKSVFQYTKIPEIYDDVFKFKIVDYIVPELLKYDHPKRKKGETLFVFPFEDPSIAYEEILDRVENLQNPILFLTHLSKIRIKVFHEAKKTPEVYEYSKEVLFSENYAGNITLRKLCLTDLKDKISIFLFSKNEKIIHNEEEAKLPIYVGFYYDEEKQKLITDVKQNVYCFFPTKENFETCYVCHAPFLLTDNRQNLKPSEDVNELLINSLAKLATQAILRLRDYGKKNKACLIDENIIEILPSFQDSSYYWSTRYYRHPFQTVFDEFVENNSIFLSRNGKYLKKQEAYVGGPRELIDLLSKEQLKALRKSEVSIDFLKWELIKRLEDSDLIENYYSSEMFARDITSDFMSKQNFKWISKMYTFLRTSAPKLWKFTGNEQKKELANLPFRKAPIIKIQDGSWVQPYTDNITANVFLPIGDKLTSEYNFIHIDYLEDEMSKKFFDELEIRQPDELDYIRHKLLAKYTEANEEDIDEEDIVADMNVIVHYYINNRQNEEDFIQLLRENLSLVNEDGYLCKPSKLYISNKRLRLYYKNNQELFIDESFYNETIQKFGRDIFISFLFRLGVNKYPIVQKRTYDDVYKLNSRIRETIYKDAFYVLNVSEWNINDYQLDNFAESLLIGHWGKELSTYIWNEVLPNTACEEYVFFRIRI